MPPEDLPRQKCVPVSRLESARYGSIRTYPISLTRRLINSDETLSLGWPNQRGDKRDANAS
jgi:hypothetical protein